MKFKLVLGYRGHGGRHGIERFANGVTLRMGSIALHVWAASCLEVGIDSEEEA